MRWKNWGTFLPRRYAMSLSRVARLAAARESPSARAEEAAPMMILSIMSPRMMMPTEYQVSAGERGTTLAPMPVVISTAKNRAKVYWRHRV